MSELVLEFPKFLTHVFISKNKLEKIGYNKIYAGIHWTSRKNTMAAIHTYIDNCIYQDTLKFNKPVKTRLTIYAPLNYGHVTMRKNKETGKYETCWYEAAIDYKANWDLDNLANIWLKCLNDVIVKKGIIQTDTVDSIRQTTYRFISCAQLDQRKLVYEIKTIENEL